MKAKTKIILPRVYLLTYPTQYELCMTFVRIQEFYESPKFRGKYFTLEEYMDYWSKVKGNGAFTYTTTWNGFNLPGEVIVKWLEVCRYNDDEMRPREQELLNQINDMMCADKVDSVDMNKIYVIGAHGEYSSVSDIVDHETSHAIYRMYPEYRKSCNKILKKIGSKEMKDMEKTLITLGYCKKVIPDEIQAYSSVDSGLLYNGFKKEFRENFNEFRKSLVNKKL